MNPELKIQPNVLLGNREESDPDEFFATLVHADEYMRSLNQVSSLNAKHIRFIKRRFASTVGYEIVEYPMDSCVSVKHSDERSVLRTVAGVFMMFLAVSTLYMAFAYWDRLSAGTAVPIGALGLVGFWGMTWAFGARRHKLVFELRDGTKLTWKSRAGDHKYKVASVTKILEFAQSRGLCK